MFLIKREIYHGTTFNTHACLDIPAYRTEFSSRARHMLLKTRYNVEQVADHILVICLLMAMVKHHATPNSPFFIVIWTARRGREESKQIHCRFKMD